jgi:hypothetical protein
VVKRALINAETALFTAGVAAPVHYLGAVVWPWALVIGVAVAMTLRPSSTARQPCASRSGVAPVLAWAEPLLAEHDACLIDRSDKGRGLVLLDACLLALKQLVCSASSVERESRNSGQLV